MIFPFCGSKNQIVFNNYDSLNLNFYQNLQMKDSIIIKNSKNISLTIDSKINKIIIFNSNNIFIKIKATITGIDIDNCNNINIIPIKPYDLKMIHAFKSNVILHVNDYELFYYNPPFKVINELSILQVTPLHE